MKKKQVTIPFEELTPELSSIVREIKKTRRFRGLTEIIIGLTFVAGHFGPATLPILFLRKPFTKQTEYLYEELAKKIEKKVLISPKITENFPVLSVDGRGDLIFRKLTKKEKLQIKLHIGRHRRLIQKRKTHKQKFMDRVKQEPTKDEKAFKKTAERLDKFSRLRRR